MTAFAATTQSFLSSIHQKHHKHHHGVGAANGTAQTNSKAATSTAGATQTAATPLTDSGLTASGNVINTGRYQITVNKDDVKVLDTQTNTWVDASGDPHMTTSDGDQGEFQHNLTIDLADGSKLTYKTTPVDGNGVAYIDSVAVTKGQQAVVATGIHDGNPQVGDVLSNADVVDGQFDDGTVMRAGNQVDDLSFAADGTEFKGSDPNGRWGQIDLDGHGGTSINGLQQPAAQAADSPETTALKNKLNDVVNQIGALDPSSPTYLKDLKHLTHKAQNLENSIQQNGAANNASDNTANGTNGANGANAAAGTNGATGDTGNAGNATADNGTDGNDGTTDTGSTTGGNSVTGLGRYDGMASQMSNLEGSLNGVLDQMSKLDPNSKTYQADLQKLSMKAQMIQSAIQLLTSTITNLMKSDSDTQLTIARNLH